jgi:hypothetical protein
VNTLAAFIGYTLTVLACGFAVGFGAGAFWRDGKRGRRERRVVAKRMEFGTVGEN